MVSTRRKHPSSSSSFSLLNGNFGVNLNEQFDGKFDGNIDDEVDAKFDETFDEHVARVETFPLMGIKKDDEKWIFSVNVKGNQLPLCIVSSIKEATNIYKRVAYVCGKRFISLSLSREEKVDLREVTWNEFYKQEKERLLVKTRSNFLSCQKELIEKEFDKNESLELEKELIIEILNNYKFKRILREENEISDDEMRCPEPDESKLTGIQKKTRFHPDPTSKKERWQVTIHHKKKNYYLGCLDTKDEAILLYDKAAYVLGKKMNFELLEEEKEKLKDIKWDDFLLSTRTSLGIRTHYKTLLKENGDFRSGQQSGK